MTAGDVDGLASRARRSLVLAVGGLEPAIGCTGTRSALEAGSLDRAAKVHLLRCPVCRGVRRALRPPETSTRPVVVERLSAAIPGFASGGGILAALTAKAATAPVLAKTAAIVVAAVAAGGAAEQAIINTHSAHHGRSHGGQAQIADPSSKLATHSGAALAVMVTPPRTTHAARTSPATPVARGAAAAATDRHGSSDTGSDHGGRASGSDGKSSDDHSGSGKAGGVSGGDRASGHDGQRSSTSASSGKGDGGSGRDSSPSGGTPGATGAVDHHGDSGASGTGSGSDSSADPGTSGSSGSSKSPGDTSGSSPGDEGATTVVSDPAIVSDPALVTTTVGGSD
jgi:hypothetical protein